MTKRVRIENADTAPYRVNVLVYEERLNLEDRLVDDMSLNNPCDQVEVHIYPGRYLVISEQTESADDDTTPA